VASAVGFSSNPLFINKIQVNGVTGTGIPEGYIYFASDPGGKPPGCNTGTASNIMFMSGNLESIKLMTSVATSAFLAGKRVTVYFDGNCAAGMPRIVAVQLQP
jgi:hypothetical protein